MQKIRKGDQVVVTTGREKGKRGTVLRVLEGKLLIEGVNRVKKHTRPNPMKGQTGGIVEREASIHISNVMLFNAAANKGDRVGFRTLDDGRKVRTFRSSGEQVDA